MNKSGRPANWEDFKGTGVFIIGCGILGLIGVVSQSALDISAAFLMAIAATATGATVGFLFGIPRPSSSTVKSDDGNPNDDSPPTPTRSASVTNLEEIADWLTKILLGAGLTQISKVPEGIENMALRLSGRTNLATNVVPITIAIWVYFVIVGFFLGYLLTRLFVAGALIRAQGLGGGTVVVAGEEYSLEEIVSQMRKGISDLQDHVAKQVAPDGEVQPPATITEKTQVPGAVSIKSLLWIDEAPPSEPILIEKLNTLKVAVKQAKLDLSIATLSTESFDKVVMVVPTGENQLELDANFLEIVKQIASTIDKSSTIVVFCSPEAKSRLAAQVTTLGISGITSSPIDLLALLGVAQ